MFAMTLALVIMGQSRPWSDRYLFLAFNARIKAISRNIFIRCLHND
jgi:hypothetical protein